MAAVLIVLATVAGDYVKVTGTHVRLRHSASLQGKIYSNANGVPIYPDKGALLQYTGERGDFYQVNYQGRTLYISKQFSRVVSGSGTSRSAGQSRDISWIYGNWRYRMTTVFGPIEARIGVTQNALVMMMDGEMVYAGPYKIVGNQIRYDEHPGRYSSILIDWNNRRLMADESHAFTRF